MAVRDLTAHFDGTLDYPGVPSEKHKAGKTYKVPSPNAATGLRLTALANLANQVKAGVTVSPEDLAALNLSTAEEHDLYKQVLGPVYEEMISDGVGWLDMQRVGRDAYLCFAMSEDAADRALTLAIAGKAEAPTPAPPQPTPAKAGRKSKQRQAKPSGDSVTPTPEPASTASSPSSTPEQEHAEAV